MERDVEPAPKVRVTNITELETCVLRRRRAGITLPTLAKTIGISRFWLNQMERGHANPERLIAYWQTA